MQDTVLFPGIHQAYIPMSGRFRCAQSSHDAGVQAVNILARIGNDYLHFSGTLLYCIQMDVDQCVEVGGLVQFRIKERCWNEEPVFYGDDAGIACAFAVRHGAGLSKSEALPWQYL